jgi:hypothetical protein
MDFARLRASTVILLAAICAVSAASAAGADRRAQPQTKTVRLAIDFGDGAEKVFAAVPWTSGQTVMDALAWADKHPRGIDLKTSGSGLSAFVRSIDGLENEGGGATARNWLFRLNDKLSNVGAGTCEVQAGDEIRWKFGVYKPDEN